MPPDPGEKCGIDAYVSAVASLQLSRSFASAGVNGEGADAFGPWVMAQIGRQLMQRLEASLAAEGSAAVAISPAGAI